MHDWPDPHGSNPQGCPWMEKDASYYDTRIDPVQSLAAHWSDIGSRRVTWYPALSMCRGKILDLGCGPGHFARMALDLGHEYICGIDGGERAVEVARKRCPPAFFRQSNLTRLLPWFHRADFGWWMEQADTVVILEVLEHVYPDLFLLQSIPHGKDVVLSVPNFDTKTHCRWFGSVAQIVMRYGVALDIQRVIVEKANNDPKRWAIVKGRRR